MTPKQTLAYSYIRFSSPEQAKGDSLRRQTKLAEEYVARRGLKLDTELNLRDLGVSAFRGANAATGALGAFLAAIKDGTVARGSYLLVEALDRVSRNVARKAIRILEEIVEAGVTVVTLNDGKEYTEKSLDGFDFVMAVVLLIRGNEESEMKSRRIAASWSGKRKRVADGELKLISRQMPAWLEARNGKPALIPERAAIVQRIFKRFVAGHGQVHIARDLTADKIPTWGYQTRKAAPYWRKSYVAKILHNPAAVGVLVSRVKVTDEKGKARKVAQPQVPNYFPAVIDTATWERARALLNTTGHARGPIANILAGLAKCPRCGTAMERVMKGSTSKGGFPKLVCSKAKHGGACTSRAVKLFQIEAALAGHKFNAPHFNSKLAKDMHDVDASIEGLNQDISNLLDALAERPSEAIKGRLAKLEAERDRLQKVLADLTARGAESNSKTIASRAAQLTTALAAKPLDIPKANIALRNALSAVVVDWEVGTLRMQWRHGGETEVRYTLDVFEEIAPEPVKKPRAKFKARRLTGAGK